MATGGELYEPSAPGFLLLFSITWFSTLGEESSTTLAHAFRKNFKNMIRYLSVGLGFLIIASPFTTFVYQVHQVYTGQDILPVSVSSLVNGFLFPITILIDFLSWLPLEVGVVAFALAFLHIVTGGEKYATD